MSLKEEQAKEYLVAARLSLDAAKAILDTAIKSDKNLWAQAIKNAYDATEQALSAAIAASGEVIPKEHPEKIKRFILLHKPSREIEEKLYFWLRKRAKAQYIDIAEGKIFIPHRIFVQGDAERAIEDCRKIVEYIAKMLEDT